MKNIICIVGPTSSGKTAHSIELALKTGGEVVSADSRQVYAGLDIGTGKVTKEEMRGIPHHLLDVANPITDVFTAEDFVRLADDAILDITSRGKIPIVCGGTGFYIDTLVGLRSFPKVPVNTALRASLEEKTADELFAILQTKDPRRAAEIDAKNPRRLVRALEIIEGLGTVPVYEVKPRYQVEWIGIQRSQEELERRIHTRLIERVEAGMVNEAERLYEKGLTYEKMASFGLEYKWLAKFVKGEIDHSQFMHELEKDIIRYSKRQMTWWRPNKSITWINT